LDKLITPCFVVTLQSVIVVDGDMITNALAWRCRLHD